MPNICVEINIEITEEDLLEFEKRVSSAEFRKMQIDRGVPTLDELFPKTKVH